MSEPARDAGLVRVVGPVALAASMLNSVVGASIFLIPASLAAAAGRYAPLAIIVCGLAIAAIAVCFAAGGQRIATSGGPYGYVQSAFGPLAGCVAGVQLWLSDLLGCGGIAAALGDAVAVQVPHELAVPVRVAVVLGSLGLVAAINIAGVAWGARFVAVSTFLKVVPLLVLLGVGAARYHSWTPAPAMATSMQDFGRAMILVFFSFTGFETALIASGEIARPRRTIPLALGIALGGATLLYVSIQVVAQGLLGEALARSSAPLADAMGKVHPALQLLLLLGASVSMFAWLGSDLLGTPRMLFAFARDGLMPAVLGRVHPRTRAPHVAILCYSALAAALALSGSFTELAVLSSLPTAAVYLGACAAVWVLVRREAAPAGAPPPTLVLRLAAIIGISSMLVIIALASWAEIGGLAVMLALGVALYGVRVLRLRPAALR